MENLILKYLVENYYASDYSSAFRICQVASNKFLNAIINEAYDKKYNEVVRVLHRHLSSDSSDPRNRVNLLKYLERRKTRVKPGGEYYSSGRQSSRPVNYTRRRGLTPEKRQELRDTSDNVDLRFSEKPTGNFGITKNPKKLRKQRALGEHP